MNQFKTVFLHFFIWLFILFLLILIGARSGNFTESVVVFLYFGLINIAVFYINFLYILPKYLNTRQYVGCTFSILILLLISSFVKYALASVYSDVVLTGGENRHEQLAFWEYFLAAFFTGLFFVILSTGIKFAVDWFVNEKIRKNLENEKLSAELSFLKSQINPHFLFNSLNNIYSLAYQHSEKTPEAILKLSEIMRYMLQESNDPRVELSKEIRYLENYIELQKLRFKGHTYIQMTVEGAGYHQSVAPLILIAFVENAFKHGVATDPSHPITIDFYIGAGFLNFNVRNRKSIQNKDDTSGIGLNNVKRRLELLYPGNYELEIVEDKNTYNCKLKLIL